MIDEKAKGLLAIWADIEDSYKIEFRQWHNCEHTPERVNIPGFIAGYRYCGIEGAHDYLMFYETTDSKVLASEPYLHSVNNATSWTRKSLPHFRNTVRNIYNQIHGVGTKPPLVAPFLFVGRFGLTEGSSRQVIDSYKDLYMRRITELPGVLRSRLYESDKEVSGITSGEKKLHGAKPASQPFVALFELSSLDVVSSESWKQIERDGAIMGDVLSQLEEVTKEKYWLDFTINAPVRS